MSWVNQKEAIQAELSDMGVPVILCTKESWFWRALAVLVGIFADRERFLNGFATTIGPMQAYPVVWSRETVLGVGVHEARHTWHSLVLGLITLVVALGGLSYWVASAISGIWWVGLIAAVVPSIVVFLLVLWRPWKTIVAFAGLPLYAVLYLLLPLPAGLAFFRYYFELDADRFRWRHMLASGQGAPAVRNRAQRFAKTITSSSYAWSWPSDWAAKAFAVAAEEVIREYGGPREEEKAK